MAAPTRVYALATVALVFATGTVTTMAVVAGRMPLATGWPSAGTFAAEVLLYLMVFEAYFYGLHRALHTRALFRRVHAVHHRATTPTVSTALAFHPVEALAIVGFVPAAMWLVPVHLASLVVVSVFLSGSILVAHCGREVFPGWWSDAPLLRWYVTPRVHEAHHRRFDCNFGATLSVFDRAFGTHRPEVASPR
jgi:sterol desaturase/sphingolipid hydroxylase (fatty acid hydroxylase superfamily)